MTPSSSTRPLPSAADVEAWVRGSADEELGESGLVERIRLLEELKTQAAAAQARLAVSLDVAVRGRHRDLELPSAQQGRGVASQLAAARRESPFRGGAIVSALLPVAQGVAVWAALKTVADTLTGQGDERSRGQIMADTLVERVTGQAAAAEVPVHVNLTVSDEALLAGGTEPAWLADFGPIPSAFARDLVDTATQDAIATLRRLYVASTGQLMSMDSVSTAFPKNLALFLDLRDQTCRTPAQISRARSAAAVADSRPEDRGRPLLTRLPHRVRVRCLIRRPSRGTMTLANPCRDRLLADLKLGRRRAVNFVPWPAFHDARESMRYVAASR